MAKKIAKFSKGSSSRTLLHAAVANELVDRLNALSEVKVIVRQDEGTSGTVTLTDTNMTIEIPVGSPSSSEGGALFPTGTPGIYLVTEHEGGGLSLGPRLEAETTNYWIDGYIKERTIYTLPPE